MKKLNFSVFLLIVGISWCLDSDFYELIKPSTNYSGIGFLGKKSEYSHENSPPNVEFGNTWKYRNSPFSEVESIFLFGGNQGLIDGFRLMWQLDISDSSTKNQWRFIHGEQRKDKNGEEFFHELGEFHPDNLPRAFSASGTAVSAERTFMLFGGINGIKNRMFNEVWEFEFKKENVTGMWRKLSNGTFSQPVYGKTNVYHPNNHPYQFAMSQFHNSYSGKNAFLTVTGGYDNYHSLTQIWEWSNVYNSWRFIKGPKSTESENLQGNYPSHPNTNCSIHHFPSSRAAASTWLVDGILYFFGGGNFGENQISDSIFFFADGNFQFRTQNDLWRFDPITNIFCWISGPKDANQDDHIDSKYIFNANNVPPGLLGSVTWSDSMNSKLYLGFGLKIGGIASNSIFIFDISRNSWKLTNGEDGDSVTTSENLPKSAFGVANWFVSNTEVYFFAGGKFTSSKTIQEIGETWKYSKKEVSCFGLDLDDPLTCKGNGNCIANGNIGECQCSNGFYGSQCNSAINSDLLQEITTYILIGLLVIIPSFMLFCILLLICCFVALGFGILNEKRKKILRRKRIYCAIHRRDLPLKSQPDRENERKKDIFDCKKTTFKKLKYEPNSFVDPLREFRIKRITRTE